MHHLQLASLIAYGAIAVALLAALPFWPWSRGWGYSNALALALILAVVSINAALSHLLA